MTRLVDPEAVTKETVAVTLEMLYKAMGPEPDDDPKPKPKSKSKS